MRWRRQRRGRTPAEQIEELSRINRDSRSPEIERQLLRLRHLEGIRLLDGAPPDPEYARPDAASLPDGAPPELNSAQLTPGLLRAAILERGCALVRQLIDRGAAELLAREIDQAYALRAAGNGADAGGYYDEFQPDARFGGVLWRAWIQEGGGLLAADSPRLCFAMFELFRSANLPALVSGYLGEPALISVHKSTLRKAEPAVSGEWHQDGKFMGPVRSLNLWLSLSRCGDEAPGLDLVPRRLPSYLDTGTEGAALDWTISEHEVQGAADGCGVIRPVFEPGDALFFDELFLHKTGSDPEMQYPRFAIENWFFGGSAFPEDYAPLAA